jgi:hypothetical protein
MKLKQGFAALLLVAVLLPAAGCNSVKQSHAIIRSDPAHAPENEAYYAQRLLEKVVARMVDAVLNTSTPREVADGIKLVLPATKIISDGLVTARKDYIQRKADLEAMIATGEDATAQRKAVNDALAAMRTAQEAADRERANVVSKFGGNVSFSFEEAATGEPIRAVLPLLLFLPTILGTLGQLATQLAPKSGGAATVSHYFGLVNSLFTQGMTSGIDLSNDLKELQVEMQTLVDENRAATDEEMQASNDRLTAAVAKALAHDTSGHPSIKD